MRSGTLVGIIGGVAGLAIAVYFTAVPVFSALAAGSGISTGSIGALLGIGLGASGAMLGVICHRRNNHNA